MPKFERFEIYRHKLFFLCTYMFHQMKWISEHQPINFAVQASLGLNLFMPRNTNWRIDKSEIIKQQSDHQTRRLLLDIVPCSSELYESYACTYVRVHTLYRYQFWCFGSYVGVNGVFCLVHLRAQVPIIMHIPCFLISWGVRDKVSCFEIKQSLDFLINWRIN